MLGHIRKLTAILLVLSLWYIASGCHNQAIIGADTTSEVLPAIPGLTDSEVATLNSLTKVADHPLYTMRSTGEHSALEPGVPLLPVTTTNAKPWACSLFATLGDTQASLFGRNFDWDHSPALLFFSDPPDGYASVSMVDLAFFVPEEKLDHLTDLPVAERIELLDAPYWPFDGMNEHGVVMGMAAVPESPAPEQAGLEGIGSLGIMREVLDHAQNLDQALEIMTSYNIIFAGGPQIHYLLADASGRAVLVELYNGELRQIPNRESWLAATNFTLSAVKGDSTGRCWRYDTMNDQLEKTAGQLTQKQAMALLTKVAQSSTQWSLVYGIHTQNVTVSMGRDYNHTMTFSLSE